jgi:hypothetical protein
MASTTLGALAPDRSPDLAGIAFDPGRGLSLPEDATVFVADGRYAAFSADVDLVDGPPPTLVLRTASGTTYEVGGVDCPFAAVLPAPTAPATLHFTRQGTLFAVGIGANPPSVCARPAPSERAAIGLRGHGSTVRNLKVSRPTLK